jgi:hypothetical protein
VNEDENSSTPLTKPGKRADNDDDTFLERFQQQQRKREKLETKEKISHRVFCPFYPEVCQIQKKTIKILVFIFRSNKNVGGYMLLIGNIIH